MAGTQSSAALLGHRTLEMTMTYARIADRTVADEYSVTDQIETLHTNQLAADKGPNMRRLRKSLTPASELTRPAEFLLRHFVAPA